MGVLQNNLYGKAPPPLDNPLVVIILCRNLVPRVSHRKMRDPGNEVDYVDRKGALYTLSF